MPICGHKMIVTQKTAHREEIHKCRCHFGGNIHFHSRFKPITRIVFCFCFLFYVQRRVAPSKQGGAKLEIHSKTCYKYPLDKIKLTEIKSGSMSLGFDNYLYYNGQNILLLLPTLTYTTSCHWKLFIEL